MLFLPTVRGSGVHLVEYLFGSLFAVHVLWLEQLFDELHQGKRPFHVKVEVLRVHCVHACVYSHMPFGRLIHRNRCCGRLH